MVARADGLRGTWNIGGVKTEVIHGWYFSSPPLAAFSHGWMVSILL
jgi:hypothetical protein